MEFRGHQEGTRTTNSLGYGHLSLDSSGGERRRNGNDNNNGSGIISTHSQTLDPHNHNHHLQQLQQLNLDHPQQRTPVSGTGAAISPVSGRSDVKTPSRSSIRYRECLKNHAASIGGNVVDGCGEFMPSGENGTLEALTCAACNCHRNFHRKEVDGETQFRRSMVVHPLHLPPPLPSPSPIHHQRFSSSGHFTTTINAPPMAVAYGGGTSGGTESSSEELNNNNGYDQSNVIGEVPRPPAPPFGSSKKRFRTRFTQEQKDRMLEFAEKVGWRIQKQYEGELEKLCDEVGVKRQVLKVWMHNNKNNSMKKQLDQDQDQEQEQEQEQEQPS